MSPHWNELLALFEKHGVDYMVIGAMAVAAHGRPRYTKDLDLWVRSTEANGAKIRAAMDEFGFAEVGFEARDFVEEIMLQLGVEPNRIDVLNRIAGVEFDDCWQRRVVLHLLGLHVPVIGFEDLVKNKLATGRGGDIGDVEALMHPPRPGDKP